MGRKRLKDRGSDDSHKRVSEVVAISIKIQLDNFLKDEEETELKFPSSLSKEERAFIHEKAKIVGIKSKSTGTGPSRYITIFKRGGSAIIQKDANLILSTPMKESIKNLLANHPITLKEKEDILSGCEKDKGFSIMRELSHLSAIPMIPNTFTNPDVLNFKRELPVYNYKDQILSSIRSNQVTIILGETGSGKTTQVPQFILDQYQQEKKPCRIICTQPRRISAISVSERVAYERNESVGHSIGYQIRLDSKTSSKTILTYCTSGVLLRTLMGGSNTLNNITHIIVDEVHERDKLADFLLIYLKDIALKFKDLHIILMSATIDPTIFSRYFNNCPVLTIPGRLFDVEQYFLDTILEMTEYFSKDMEKARRRLGFEKPKKSNENKVEESKPKKESVEEDKSISIDSDLQADFDGFLNDCYNDGSSDSFGQILYMYMSENVPVNCKHSATGLTGLMAAAYHGANETVEQLIQMGASPTICDNSGKSAVDYAKMKDHNECAQFLGYLATGVINVSDVMECVEDNNSTEDHNELLEMYLQTIGEDCIDYNLIVHLLKYIHLTYPMGSILVFIAGYEDIITLKSLIESCDDFNKKKYQLFTLHSNMQTSDQKRVFSKIHDTRKIILSTNIAETSITINDVVYIIDSVKAKELYYEPASGACSLQLIWTSKACCRQRAGRAGRLQPGKCFTLCSKRRFQSLLENSIPEILRAPLHELCLQTKRLAPTNTPIADFLSKAVEPPIFTAVRNSVSLLKTIGALTPMENLTELGQLLLELPIDPHLGKMLIYACVFKCLDPILTITSSLSFNEPFQIGSDPESRKRAYRTKKSFAGESFSDHMILLKAYQEWNEARVQKRQKNFCERTLVNGVTMELITGLKTKFFWELRSIGLIKSKGIADMKELNVNSDKWYVVKAVLFSGFYPSIARIDRHVQAIRSSKEARLHLHPQTTLLNGTGKENHYKSVKNCPTDWIMFGDMSRLGRLCYIRNNTLITDITVALFGGPLRILPNALHASPLDESEDSEADEEPGDWESDISYLSIDDWIVFKSKFNDGLAILLLREKFAAMMIRRMSNPSKPIMPADNSIIDTIVDLLAKEEYKVGLALQMGVWQGQVSNVQKPESSRYNENEIPKTYSNSSYRPGSSPYYGYNINNSKSRSNNYGSKDKKPFNNSKNTPHTSKAYNNSEMSGNKNCKFFLVKSPNQKTIEESQNIGKWNFLPGTERNIVISAKAGFKTILFFSVGNAVMKFFGWAEFAFVPAEGNPPTIYPIKWISKNAVSHNSIRHLMNSLDDNRRVVGTKDGFEIGYDCGMSLLDVISGKK